MAELCEGVTLRTSGIDGEIFIMVGFLSEHVCHFFDYELTPVVFSKSDIELLAQEAGRRGVVKKLHLKVDSGMSRLGIMPDEIDEFAEMIERMENVELAGVVSHFSAADNVASSATASAFSVFSAACEKLGAQFKGIRHIANSGAVLNFPETLCDMARAGISLYGYAPDGDPETGCVNGQYLRLAIRVADLQRGFRHVAAALEAWKPERWRLLVPLADTAQ